jgi:hypothetical protein
MEAPQHQGGVIIFLVDLRYPFTSGTSSVWCDKRMSLYPRWTLDFHRNGCQLNMCPSVEVFCFCSRELKDISGDNYNGQSVYEMHEGVHLPPGSPFSGGVTRQIGHRMGHRLKSSSALIAETMHSRQRVCPHGSVCDLAPVSNISIQTGHSNPRSAVRISSSCCLMSRSSSIQSRRAVSKSFLSASICAFR